MSGDVIPYSEPGTPIGYSRRSRASVLFAVIAFLALTALVMMRFWVTHNFRPRESILFAAVNVAFWAPLIGVTLAVTALWSNRDRSLVRTALWMNFTVFVTLMVISFIFKFA